MTEAAIQLENLSRRFDGTWAVHDLTLSVPAGEVYGFLGPNGAGKTTTLKMLAGLLSPTSGAAVVAGERVRPGEASIALRRRIGFLPEEPSFYGWMTARELLVFTGRVFELSRQEASARAAELLALVDLADRAGDKIRGFSRGMRQRLGIAQALMGSPEVLLLDEPASALDPIGRKEILDLIASLRGRATIVMSSHILDDVQRVSTWVGIIRKGTLVVASPLRKLLESYAQPVFRLEIAADETARRDLATLLASEPWCRDAHLESAGIRVVSADLEAGQRRIPLLVAEQGLRLVEFGTETPTLEDVFITLVGAGQ